MPSAGRQCGQIVVPLFGPVHLLEWQALGRPARATPVAVGHQGVVPCFWRHCPLHHARDVHQVELQAHRSSQGTNEDSPARLSQVADRALHRLFDGLDEDGERWARLEVVCAFELP